MKKITKEFNQSQFDSLFQSVILYMNFFFHKYVHELSK